MQTRLIEMMHCPRCHSKNFKDNGETDPDPIRYRCSVCAMIWTWSPSTNVMEYDNGNGGTTKVIVEISKI